MVFTAGDLVTILKSLSVPRRRAIWFAVECNLPLKDVIELTWAKAGKVKQTEVAKLIISGVPRHLRLDYVFWEYLPNLAVAPLLGLRKELERAANGLTYEQLRDEYQAMLWVDSNADAKDFKGQMGIQ